MGGEAVLGGAVLGRDDCTILVILWTACVECPRKFPHTFPRQYPSVFEISRMEGFSRGRLSGTSFPVPVPLEILGHGTGLLVEEEMWLSMEVQGMFM